MFAWAVVKLFSKILFLVSRDLREPECILSPAGVRAASVLLYYCISVDQIHVAVTQKGEEGGRHSGSSRTPLPPSISVSHVRAKRSTIGGETLLISTACIRVRDRQQQRKLFFYFPCFPFFLSSKVVTWSDCQGHSSSCVGTRIVALTSAGVINLNELLQADRLNGHSPALPPRKYIEILLQATLDPVDPLNSRNSQGLMLSFSHKIIIAIRSLAWMSFCSSPKLNFRFKRSDLKMLFSCWRSPAGVLGFLWGGIEPFPRSRSQVNFFTLHTHGACLVANVWGAPLLWI